MQSLTVVLALLLAVAASGILHRWLPARIPAPLVQVGLGAFLAVAIGFDVPLDPEIFFLLLVPPLLFLDGWRIPKGAFFRDLRPILTLAIGLVIFTVIGMGLFIDWLVPAIPPALAFALAAILSPTDPVAVSAIAARTPIPPRLMHILEGESLLNDASGLVCFRFAVAAAMTGHFSLTAASVEFLRVGAGGLLIGVAVSAVIALANRWLIRPFGEEPGLEVLITLLVPFSAYLAAEHLRCSGILAAAAAGIAMHYLDLTARTLAVTRMQRTIVWDTVQMILNGTVFVLLGLQMPGILDNVGAIARHAGVQPWLLVAYVAALTLALTALRFLWVFASLKLTLFRARGSAPARSRSFLRLLGVASFAGVRGTITLAGVLTLPHWMPAGGALPARDLAIFLAVGVILLSLVLASIMLPILGRGMESLPQTSVASNEAAARASAAEAAIRRVEALRGAARGTPGLPVREAAAHVADLYRRRLDYGRVGGDEAHHARAVVDAERGLRLEALAAERDELYRLRIAGQIDDPLHRKLVREIDLTEAALSRGEAH